MNADLDFFRSPSSIRGYLFAYHNEHVVASTRLISLVDYVFFGSQYRLHQYVAAALLGLLASAMAALACALRGHRVSDRCALMAFASATLLAPIMVPVVAFPYFLQHFMAAALGLCISVVGWSLYRPGLSPYWRLAFAVVALAIGLSLLATSGHGVLLAISAVMVPVVFSAKSTRQQIVPTAATGFLIIVVWSGWFAGPTGDILAKLVAPGQWLGILDYYFRILGLPAYFASGSLWISVLFAVLVFVSSFIAIACAFRYRHTDDSLISAVTASILVGHQLSIALVSVARSGTGFAAEDPKYAFYTLIIIVSAAILIAKNLHREGPSLLGFETLMAGALVIVLGTESHVLVNSRQFFRTVEAFGQSLALSLDDPDRKGLVGDDPSVWDRVNFARSERLNAQMRHPGDLLGRRMADLMISSTCRGGVESERIIPAHDGGVGIKLSGWLLDDSNPHHRGLSIVVAQGHQIVGYGTFVSIRSDIHAQINSAVSRDAPDGWTAYARPLDGHTPLKLYGLDVENLTACYSERTEVPPLDLSTLPINAQFLQDAVRSQPLSPLQRWDHILNGD
jgi:hypothetical protein